MTAITTSHIVLDDRGRPWIEGTNTKVIEVAAEKAALGWDADEIHRQHPHLPLSKIHAALAYYYDHQQEIDHEIEREYRDAERLRRESPTNAAVVRKLKSLGKLL